MANQLTNFQHWLRQLARPAADEPADGSLLARFAADRSETAFRTLMGRHGPLVLGVCRRVLGDAHEAEDVFQATFLVLARKAGKLQRQRSLASWLYTVAHNLAVDARLAASRRRQRERDAAMMHTEQAGAAADHTELRTALDAELSVLPDKYRAPLVLCYLQGKTNEEAAQELGWPTGSMARRLDRARTLLRDRLSRRGLALGTGLALSTAATDALATVPPPLADLTARSALDFAAGATITGGAAHALAQGALHAMRMHRIKLTAVLFPAIMCAVVGAGFVWHRLRAAPPDTAANSPPVATSFQPVQLLIPDPLANVAWGPEANGLRVHLYTDRDVYRRSKDLINVTFMLKNVASDSRDIRLAMTAEERTSLVLVDAAGKEYLVAGYSGERGKTMIWQEKLKPGKVTRVNMLFDPARQGLDLPTGRYRLRGFFHEEGPIQEKPGKQPTTTWTKVESNEAAISLVQPDMPWPTGPSVQERSLSLFVEPAATTIGGGPLRFHVVYNAADDKRGPLSIVGRTYYSLEVTDPDGKKLHVPQPAPLPSSVSPHFRFSQPGGGKSVGERLAWDPSRDAAQRTTTFDDFVQASGPRAPRAGWYTVRAIYEVDAGAEAKFSYGITAERLVSNPVTVYVGDPDMPFRLSAEQVQTMWEQLGSRNVHEARAAAFAMAADPRQGLAIIQKCLTAVPSVEPQRLAAWIADLESPRFEVRQRAEKALADLGEQCAPALRQALAARPPLETSARLEKLLSQIAMVRPETLRALYAIEVLERIRTPAARQLLETVAKGAPESWVTQRARAALQR